MKEAYPSFMRHFYFLSFALFTFSAFAADCTNPTPPFPASCDNLYITSTQDYSGATGPLVLNVIGEVVISANIILDGSSGSTVTATSPGGAAGPQAGVGGGFNATFNTSEDGQDGMISNGKKSGSDPCPNGGGGGGLYTAGQDGARCPTTGQIGDGTGGAIAFGGEFDFAGNFRGGYGGGSGGINTSDVGTGGGGGGALKIVAGGNVTIQSGVTISARGGNGGSASNGGGGGAGSGGALWIQSSGLIKNSATIDLRGGTGGPNTSGTSVGGRGGNGGDGVYQFEDLLGTTNGSGLTAGSSSSSGLGSKLNSSITCGSIQKNPKNSSNEIFMILVGFLSALLLLPKKSFSRNK